MGGGATGGGATGGGRCSGSAVCLGNRCRRKQKHCHLVDKSPQHQLRCCLWPMAVTLTNDIIISIIIISRGDLSP